MRTMLAGLALAALGLGPALATETAEEDCVAIDPAALHWDLKDGRWKIVDRGRNLFDFGKNRTEARKALGVLQHYRFDAVCYVGRPHPSFVYLKRGTGTPTRNTEGDQCQTVDTAKLHVAQAGGQWRLTDGHTRVKTFPSEAEAQTALTAVRRYNLAQRCVVGGPESGFEYWLAR